MKHILIVTILFLFSINVFSQKDTTICFELNSTENQNINKNYLSLDVCYVTNSNIPMLGINYERILRKNKTLSISVGSNNYQQGIHNDIASYSKFEYRFYFPDTGIPRTSSFNDDFYLQKKKKTLSTLEGFYLGLTAVYRNNQNTFYYNEKTTLEFINSFGIGGSLGYQFILFNKIQTNISLPLAFGFQKERTVVHGNSTEEIYADLSGYINISFGIAI